VRHPTTPSQDPRWRNGPFNSGSLPHAKNGRHGRRFNLPGLEERARIIKQYFEQFLVNSDKRSKARKITIAGTAQAAAAFPRPCDKGRIRRLAPPAVLRWCPRLAPDVDEGALRAAAEKTEGFSGRELNKMIISMQAAAYATDDATLTRARFEEVLDHFVEQHQQRQQWQATTTPH